MNDLIIKRMGDIIKQRYFVVFACLVIGVMNYMFLSHEAGAAEDALFYKVGVNDMITIKVIDHPELLTSATVGEDGTITFPYIGAVYVKGLTLTDIEKEVTEKLSAGYVKYPVVSVSLTRAVMQKIFSYGEVNKRGEIPYDEDMTLEKAMSMAGGVTGNGLFGKVIVRRKQKNGNKYKDIAESMLNHGIIENRNNAEVLLNPDDILIVEPSKTFLIQGEVNNRGRFVLEKDMTAGRALLQAGGVSNEGLYGKVKVRRRREGKSGTYEDFAESGLNDGTIESSEVEDMLLQSDDILVVERSKTFLIQGEVVNRGKFKLEKDMTVVKALLQAGGITKDGLYGKVRVRRKENDGKGNYKDAAESNLNDGAIESSEVEDMLLQSDDILVVERSKTFLIQGEVVNRGRFKLEKDMTVVKALLQAGGITKDGLYGKVKVKRKKEAETGNYKEIIESKLSNGVIESQEAEEMLLQPDDILLVEKNDTYFVYGEVSNTGEYVLKDNMTVFKAITVAGGFTKWGSGSRVKVLRSVDNGRKYETIEVNINEVIRGDITADIYLQSGDIIIASASIF
jgi:polysaccharide export outer membrane protein